MALRILILPLLAVLLSLLAVLAEGREAIEMPIRGAPILLLLRLAVDNQKHVATPK